MFLKFLKLLNFRNFKEISFDFSDSLIVVEGRNGIGKTNLLESIYLLCTGKSQRKSSRLEMIHFDAHNFFVEGEFAGNNSPLNVGIGYSRDKKISLLLNGIIQESLFEWFGARSIISFSSEDILLITGGPENRRKFVDLFGSFYDIAYLRNLIGYRFYLQRRNVLLRSNNFDKIQCEVYDEKLAEFGSELVLLRFSLIDQLNRFFLTVYREIADNSDQVKIEYDSVLDVRKYSKDTCKNVFYDKLANVRKKDIDAGFSTFGPHREDLKIFLNEKNSRKFASQGQCRTLSLSMKLSSSFSLEEQHNNRSIFIIDDTVSELDTYRLDSFISLVKNRGQVFIGTPLGRLSNKEDCCRVDIPEYFH
jgi:DNA replication and repair protein RecF